VRGVVEGTKPGDQVTVWFESAGGKRSSSFTYTAKSESRRRVLVIADENYSGPVPDPATNTVGPDYEDEVVEALEANGLEADVYDVDANDMTAPHPLGVLSHYDAVVWEKGDDYVTRRPGQPGQTGQARVAIETQLAVRDFLNEGGKLFFTGKSAGQQWAEGQVFRNFGFPEPDESPTGRWCGANDNESADGCIPPDNDFQQYYLGAYIYVGGGNAQDADGNPLPIKGEGAPFGDSLFEFNGPHSADNQVHTATFALTSSILDPETFPWYADSRRARDLAAPGRGPVQPLQRPVLHVRRGRFGGVQAPPPRGRPDRQVERLPVVPVLGRSRAGLGLHGRRGPRGRDRRLDHAARGGRDHARHGRELPGGLVERVGHAPPAAPALPDGQRRRDVLAEGDHR
jgi:hypothetical protein